ncbi:MAG: hypothetical protein IT337_05940 [Thermomicrobiales bacterium]|nr:hypothetical protein [Thermomicrobiales bacterium]
MHIGRHVGGGLRDDRGLVADPLTGAIENANPGDRANGVDDLRPDAIGGAARPGDADRGGTAIAQTGETDLATAADIVGGGEAGNGRDLGRRLPSERSHRRERQRQQRDEHANRRQECETGAHGGLLRAAMGG